MLHKTSPLRSDALRRSAKGQDCTLRIPGVCNGNPDTTVLAHMPFGDGGMGTKASDEHAAFACSACHDAVDGRAPVIGCSRSEADKLVLNCCIRGMGETQAIWRRDGLVTYKGAK